LEATRQQAEQAAHEAVPWVERLARLGFVARGVVYIVVGWLAALAAFGQGGRTTDSEGALATIATKPFGTILLLILGLGLFGYALWRIVQGIMDPENKGTDAKGLVKRTGYVLSGVFYGALGYTALQLIQDTRAADRNASTQDAAATALSRPLGEWALVLAGLIIIAVGVNGLYIAIKDKFQQKLNLAEMTPTEQEWATRLGKIGLIARSVVSGIIGLFLIIAAFRKNPNEAKGLDGALKVLAQQDYGPWLLGAVAIGLMAYGVYSLVEARYRRVRVT
jgi:hypothetical protein